MHSAFHVWGITSNHLHLRNARRVHIVGERAKLYGDRAVRSSKGSEDQKKYAKHALAEFESIMEVIHDGDEEVQMELLHSSTRMMAMTDQPEEVITVANEFLLLNEKYPGISQFGEVAQVKHWKAQAYSDCGKWKDAVKSYKPLIREFMQRGEYPSHTDLMIIDCSRALYELRKYDEAIEYGKLAIELNRSLPGVHKYVALSQKAKGDIDEAKQTMSRAILYEKYWDKDNIQKNKHILKDLNSL